MSKPEKQSREAAKAEKTVNAMLSQIRASNAALDADSTRMLQLSDLSAVHHAVEFRALAAMSQTARL